MEPLVDVDAAALRASQYWVEDGLTEMLLGLLMSSQMGVLMVARALPRGPVMGFLSTFGAQALSVAITLSIFGGFKKLKARITFPRTGYVALLERSTGHRTAVFAIGIALAVFAVAGALGFQPSQTDWLSQSAVPAFAALFATCLIGGGLQYKQASMLWEGFLTLLFAAGLEGFTDLRGFKGLEVLMVIVGASMAVIGAFRFRSFLKANPKPQETEA
jgi:hypothetical protein